MQRINFNDFEIAEIKSKLNHKLEYNEVKQRPGLNGVKLAYIEGWKVCELANEIFGFNGWSSSILDMQTDFIDNAGDRFSVGISCTVRVTLKDGTFHEDIGYGSSENQRSKAAAYKKSKKEAVTDGIKRALRCFGDKLGNCIYDKDYLTNLFRRPKSYNNTMSIVTNNLYNNNDKNNNTNTSHFSSTKEVISTTILQKPKRNFTSMDGDENSYNINPVNITTTDNSNDETLILPEDDYEDIYDLLIEASKITEDDIIDINALENPSKTTNKLEPSNSKTNYKGFTRQETGFERNYIRSFDRNQR